MSDVTPEKIELGLRRGLANEAMDAAKAYCAEKGASKETGIEIARTAAAVYRDLISQPVHAFAEAAPKDLPAEVGPLVQKALQRLINMTTEWETRLWSVHTERLVREVRDWTRMRQLAPAAANVARLMALAPTDQKNKRAAYIGAVLGTVPHNQKEAKDLIALLAKDPNKYLLTAEQVRALDAAREKRNGEVTGANAENMEREFTAELTQAAVDLKAKLPDVTKIGEPDEAALRDAGDVVRSILRAPIHRRESELFLDATNILIEFVPKEQSTTSKLARVEARTYAALGYSAKKAVMMTFQDIGRNKFFCQLYAAWAKDYVGTEAVRSIVEFMGALRTQEFNDFLKSIRSDKRTDASMSKSLSTAMSSIAGAENADQLIHELKVLMAKRRLEGAELKTADLLLVNLGVAARSPRTEAAERGRILEAIKTFIPDDMGRLGVTGALAAFTFKVDDHSPQQRQWAIRILTRGLWLVDDSTAHEKGGERQESELGFRHEIAEALKKIAVKDPLALARAAEPLSTRYGAAFMAIAEVFEKVPDPTYLPVLETMLKNTLGHDESSKNSYQQEFYWDAATQERKPIDKNKILGPIIFAIGTIGGENSQAILKRYVDQIANGRHTMPPPEVGTYLQKFLGASVFDAGQKESSGAVKEVELGPIDPAELQALLKDLTAGYWLTSSDKRRMKKVAALTRLAQSTPADAIDVVFKQLTDKDIMVGSAAIGCLVEYCQPDRPKALRDLVVNTCLDRLNERDMAIRSSATKLLKDIGPNRKDIKDKVVAFAKTIDRREAKEALTAALRTSSAQGTALEMMAALGAGSEKKPEAMSIIELKRNYMTARKAWIDGGKKGDPPPKPPGVE